MSALFYRKQIWDIERAAFNLLPSFEWMARAGEAVAREATQMLAQDERIVLVIIGPGNNGGDACIAAVKLHADGRKVRAVFYGDEKKLSADAKQALQRYRKNVGEPDREIKDGDYALVIDGLFGIGLSRPLSEEKNDIVRQINKLGCPLLAIDVPSGLCGESGRAWGEVIQATKTISFFAAKPGLYTGAGVQAAGEVLIDDLGFNVQRECQPSSGSLLCSVENFSHRLRRRKNTHKGDYGTLAIIGGETGMVGALVLATRSAVRMGAGKVYALCIAKNAPAFDPLAPEVMWQPLLKAPFDDLWKNCNALAIGVGLGTGTQAQAVVAAACQSSLPLLADADALNLLAQNKSLRQAFKSRQAASVITPHPAEAARLLDCSVAEVQQDRIAAARALAEEFRAQVLLKGAGSVLAQLGGRWALCATGNPGLAQAGSGDVLLGMAAGLLAQTDDAYFSISAAAWLHGAAADEQAAASGEVGLNINQLAATAAQIIHRAKLSPPDGVLP